MLINCLILLHHPLWQKSITNVESYFQMDWIIVELPNAPEVSNNLLIYQSGVEHQT